VHRPRHSITSSAPLELQRHFEAERLGGLEVDYQIEPARLLHWWVGGLFDRECEESGSSVNRPLGLSSRVAC
jgi:hypothetical protein